jgi:hypothetical protein
MFGKHTLRKKECIFPLIKIRHAIHSIMENGLSPTTWARLSNPKAQAQQQSPQTETIIWR